MELQFGKHTIDCLQWAAWESKNEEQTQEVRLPDSMPDIGRVLGAWGQPLIRSKEWRGNGMAASGGVMAWVLYAPEDGSGPQSLETWIPFQLRWDFPQTKHDGLMCVDCQLGSIDARSVSARKLMVRCTVSASGQALEPVQPELFSPGSLPEDVQVLSGSYPVSLPREAGEKTFLLDEELTVPAAWGKVEKLIRFGLQPELIDQKVMADKVVFRGTALVHGLCQCQDGQLRSWDAEVPFSQYAQLDREYGPQAWADVVPAVTNLETELQENGTVRLKGGLVGQYVVYDRPVLEVVEDAYSPGRTVALTTQLLELPVVLDRRRELLTAEKSLEGDMAQEIEASFAVAQPQLRREGDSVALELPGNFQVLSADQNGALQGEQIRWEGSMEAAAQEDTALAADCRPSGRPRLGAGDVRCDVQARLCCYTQTRIPMVTALELGDPVPPDPDRPSLILRRAGTDRLWDLAKQMRTTVEAIREANSLTEEPEPDRLLLIPVP